MGRTKSTPIDARSLNGINEARILSSTNFIGINAQEDRAIRCIREAPFVTFSNSGTINDICEVHRKAQASDCINFRTKWTSQALLREEASWIAHQYADGVPGNKQMMKKIAQEDGVRSQQEGIIRKYVESSNEFIPRPSRIADKIRRRPKQLELPPVVDGINCLADRLKERTVNDQISFLSHWQNDSYQLAESRGRVRNLSTEYAFEAPMENLEDDKPYSSGGSDYDSASSPKQRTPATSPRACINCYERHHGCDRSLPSCSSCSAIHAYCVYPNVTSRVSPKKRKKW
ncbi:putative transcription factor cys6 protein [Botrytis fragariae]|uniref:Putative transcription factor cys6 protein n=1 Tax=Botrytis fragariae TaxID=1964551 RepID=A0A8H6APP1_9HELO|nr:putative transcription factor cys6 protein [Botrytis fragariae]KAF5871402.1 putative transcription factor cys6 protein [Botrytis fragariae]